MPALVKNCSIQRTAGVEEQGFFEDIRQVLRDRRLVAGSTL